MKKTVYARTNEKGQKETYEIMTMLFDYVSHFVDLKIRHITYDAEGIPIVHDFQQYFNESYSINVLVDDPLWNENSTPPKPAGFIFENPDTWGNLSLSDIPMTNTPALSTRLIDICAKAVNGDLDYGENTSRVMLEFLVEQKILTSGNGWAFESKIV